MRNVFLAGAMVLLVFAGITYMSCNKPEEPTPAVDMCKGVFCMNGGTCIDGACNCTAGYYGDSCEKKAIARYLGTWEVSQRVAESGDPARVDAAWNYEIKLSEHSSGATVLQVDDLMGLPGATVLGRIRTKIGQVEIDGTPMEGEVPASINEFTFNRHQPLTGSDMLLLKGEGVVDGLGEKITGEFYINYPHDSLGAVEERIVFTADFIN